MRAPNATGATRANAPSVTRANAPSVTRANAPSDREEMKLPLV